MADEIKKYEFRVLAPIIPGAEEGHMEPKLTEGDSIHLTEEEAQYLLESGVVAYPDELKARKEQAAQAKQDEADNLRKKADQLEKEAKEAAPKSASVKSKKNSEEG